VHARVVTTIRIGRRPRRWPLVIVAALAILAILFTLLAGFLTDVLWFGEVRQTDVFWTTLRTKVLLGFAFGVVFFVVLIANLAIARRLAPEVRVLEPRDEPFEQIRDLVEPYLRWALPLVAAAIALLVGVAASRSWPSFLLWSGSRGIGFGFHEQQFGRDAAFYVFTLPWLRSVQSWVFASLVGITILTAGAHVLVGSIRPQARRWSDRVPPAARAHLSVLLGLIMLAKAWGYYLGRFDLLTSTRGVVEGASYTDVNAHLPALNFLAIVAVICAVLFFVNTRVRLWSLPLIAVALLALTSVLLGTAYPAFVQQFRVRPNEQQYEAPYIRRNIDATRYAFGLDTIEETSRPIAPAVTSEHLEANEDTISNVRLWRPSVLASVFESLEQIRQYYVFNDVDVDRYEIGGQRRVLMVAAREIDQARLPAAAQTWQNLHLAYTHGYGAVAVQVNTSTPEGAPVFTLQNLPPEGEPAMAEPRIYFGEVGELGVDFVVANTAAELDYEGAPHNAEFRYQGTGGIEAGGLLKRALFAWRFRDLNLLISGQLDADSRILIYRDIRERTEKIAPFLVYDADPYLAIVDGRPVWIQDAYTTTTGFPYSQEVDLALATGSDLETLIEGQANYMRNSVKVVTDAYSGAITFYADLREPIVRAWANVYPELFTDITTASDAEREHFRYPENLLQVQAAHYANYHVTEPAAFYRKQDFWDLAPDPTAAPPEGGLERPRLRPYYLLLRLPGETQTGFHLVLPFVPDNRPNMIAWLAASSDPETFGELRVIRFAGTGSIEGPTQVFARLNQDESFSAQRTLLSQGGSLVEFGDFLVIPIEDSFLYVQPVYVRANQETAIPELKIVVVVNGSDGPVHYADSLDEALAAAVEGTPPEGGARPGEDPSALIAQALERFAAAQEALRSGDLAAYQRELAAAEALVRHANELLGAPPEVTPSPSP
jgi:hypothetical protein